MGIWTPSSRKPVSIRLNPARAPLPPVMDQASQLEPNTSFARVLISLHLTMVFAEFGDNGLGLLDIYFYVLCRAKQDVQLPLQSEYEKSAMSSANNRSATSSGARHGQSVSSAWRNSASNPSGYKLKRRGLAKHPFFTPLLHSYFPVAPLLVRTQDLSCADMD